MDDSFKNELMKLIQSGAKLEAIKRYRQKTGEDLLHAKQAVESLELTGNFPGAGDNMHEILSQNSEHGAAQLIGEIVFLLKEGKKLQAIKLHREKTGCDLRESKNTVEKIARVHGIAVPQATGCLLILFMFFECVCLIAGIFILA